MRLILTECDKPPDLPLTLTLKVPVAAELLTVRVNVLVLVVLLGLNDAVTPLGRLDADRAMLPAKPFVGWMVMVDVPVLPRATFRLAGDYMTPTKGRFQVLYQPGIGLSFAFPGEPPQKLIPIRGPKFRTPQFADDIYEFVMENGKVTALKERDPSGEFTYSRQ